MPTWCSSGDAPSWSESVAQDQPGAARQAVLLPVSVDPQKSLVAVAAPRAHATDVKESVIEIEIDGAGMVLIGHQIAQSL